jgi:hypothetical protein
MAAHLEDAMSSKKLDAAIEALVMRNCPNTSLRGGVGLRILCELGRRYPDIVK